MIRREVTSERGEKLWALIDQVDHARLAGQMAEHWTSPLVPPLDPRDDLLSAIFHHDDGWPSWDSQPGVDPNDGSPLAFNEMPLAESLAIWRRSIVLAERLGPRPAYLVAGHFTALLRRFDSWRRTGGSAQALAEAFLAHFERKMAACRPAWQEPGETVDAADRRAADGVAYLQMFDAISLWLCCAERAEAEQFAMPGGAVVTFKLIAVDRVAISPWPLAANAYLLAVTGKLVPMRPYANSDELQSVESVPTAFQWRLEPDVDESGHAN